MDPLTLALIIGAGSAGAAKLGGAKTSDALKQGILSGGLTFINPAGAAQNPFAQAFAQESGKSGLRALLLEGAKQGLVQRGARKVGIDPTLAMSAYNIFGQMPQIGTDALKNQMVPTGNDVEQIGKAMTGVTPSVTPNVPTVPTGGFDIDQLYTTGKEFDVLKGGAGGGDGGGIMKSVTDVFKTGDKYDIDKIAKGATLFGVPALLYATGAFEPKPQTMYMPTYNKNYPLLRAARGPGKRIDPITGQQVDVPMVAIPEETRAEGDVPYEFAERTFYPKEYNQGGLASIQKFNQGGLSKLPTKSTHDENDINNYMRINGYIEDDNGHKNEDTLLAQLADGEFVTRTDGVLGAGIIAGANPKNEKEMREKGAKFFYEQQSRFKRIFDLLNENRARKLH